ncbi:helix-turn-helix domain-containing protein [Labrenzia sp. PHM005]|uniref:helix-turn-helix domain-containing protein n=1 Tax=Labrenzia sp. PHM005 TaxID=2590016 RepID=UPI0011400B97|nr:helix-turn-helix domain-containing protein [Labrenzia sp. PHM005]QDG76984.1 DNA replication initiation ATPase [Labrenzia sp. PHM005]
MIGNRGGNFLIVSADVEKEPHRLLAANRLAAHLHLAEGYVSRAFCIKPHDFYIVTRGPKHVAEARQLIMYLAHVEFGLPLAVVGRKYQRDRSTASYACRTIEHRREDPFFDQLVSEIEDLITLRKDPLFGSFVWRAK